MAYRDLKGYLSVLENRGKLRRVKKADIPQHDPARLVGSRVAIDATRKHAYPAVALPPKEHLDRAAETWREYEIE